MAGIGEILTGDGVGPPRPGPNEEGGVGPTPPPPTTAEEEQNKGLWHTFLDRLKTDPNFRQATMQVGLGMMRSQKMGENAGDVVSQSLNNGVQTLDLLRQRDRAQTIEDTERARKSGLEERQAVVQERGATSQEQAVGVSAERNVIESEQNKNAYQNARDALAEATRHNKSQEEIDRLRAKADMLRANSYGSIRKGMGGAEVQKLDAMSKQFQAQGYDEVTADAMAVQYLTEKGKGKAPADRIRSMVDERIKAYNGSMEALDKPLNNEMIRQWMTESIDLDKQIESIANPQAVAPPGPNPAPMRPGQTSSGVGPPGVQAPASVPGPQVAPPQAMPGAKVDPVIAQQIKEAMGAGVDPAQIRAKLVSMGQNPADYGL